MYNDFNNDSHDYDDRNYRKIDAMYKKGYDIDSIVAQMPHLKRRETIYIIEVIYGREQQRRERYRAKQRREQEIIYLEE